MMHVVGRTGFHENFFLIKKKGRERERKLPFTEGLTLYQLLSDLIDGYNQCCDNPPSDPNTRVPNPYN